MREGTRKRRRRRSARPQSGRCRSCRDPAVSARDERRGPRRLIAMALLEVEDLTAFYGTSQALFGLSFAADAGQCITLLGRNGMGKTTTVKSVVGMLATHRGEVRF